MMGIAAGAGIIGCVAAVCPPGAAAVGAGAGCPAGITIGIDGWTCMAPTG
jgi:hypothetical protein